MPLFVSKQPLAYADNIDKRYDLRNGIQSIAQRGLNHRPAELVLKALPPGLASSILRQSCYFLVRPSFGKDLGRV